jgi:hypothetical protein
MRPADFWALHPTEFMWLLEASRPTTTYGKMTEDEVAQIRADMAAMRPDIWALPEPEPDEAPGRGWH